MVLAIEAVAITVLVAGVYWFITSYEEVRTFAGPLLRPELWVLVTIVSVVGAIGNLGLYYLGGRGAEAVFARFPYLEGRRWEWIGGHYQRWGGRILILSAIPTLGTLLTTAAGAFGIKRNVFLRWVITSKILRNWLLLLIFYGIYQSV
jgi:membrane protein YqaA with SNARE-associated domain